MRKLAFHRAFAILAICVVATIVHGSLYPYAFRIPAGANGAVSVLLRSWNEPPKSRGDLLANVLLYMPLGFAAILALASRWRLLVVTLFGLLLCIGVELAQFYDAGRVTNMSDVYLNTGGTVLGALGALLIDSRFARLRTAAVSVRPIPCLLLIVMLAYRLFPYVPTIDLHKYWHSLPDLRHPDLGLWPIAHYFIVWVAAAYLLRALARKHFNALFWLLIAFVFAGKILITGQVLVAPEIAGAALAAGAWAIVLGRMRKPAVAVSAMLCAMIIILRLQPFAFQLPATAFGWQPFHSFLRGSLETDVVSVLEKAFLYGSLIWIVSEAGLRLRTAICASAAMLLVTSMAETYLPGRSAESTDAVMALLMGGMFAALNMRTTSQLRGIPRPAEICGDIRAGS